MKQNIQVISCSRELVTATYNFSIKEKGIIMCILIRHKVIGKEHNLYNTFL